MARQLWRAVMCGPPKIAKKAAQDEWHLPLHVKDVSRLDFDKLMKLEMPPHISDNLRYLYEVCAYPSACGQLAPVTNLPEAEISAPDHEKLLIYKYVRHVEHPPTTIASTVRVFTTVESAGAGLRRRTIFWPQHINDTLAFSGDPIFPKVPEQIEAVLSHEGAILLDAPAFFTQFSLPPTSEDFFFAFEENIYQLNTFATGQRQVPAFAQDILRTIAHNTFRSDDVPHHLYIDNVRILGNRERATALAKRFQEVALAVGLTFNITSDWSTQYVFLGIQYDHVARTVTLSPKAKGKILTWLNSLQHTDWTLRNFSQLLGLLIWASRVLDAPLAQYYYVFKFFRRRARAAANLDDKMTVWPCLFPHLKRWLIQSTTVRILKNPSNRRITAWLYSDATPTGWGALLFYEGKVSVCSGPFSRPEHINVLECRALLYAVAMLATSPLATNPDVHVHIRIDNTTVVHSMANTRSTNFDINETVGRVLAALAAVSYDIAYIKSKDNHSDGLSRLYTKTGGQKR